MAEDLTPGELTRAVGALTEQVKALVDRLETDRKEFRETYLPREVYAAMHQADNAVVADLASDIRNCRDEMVREIKGLEERFDREADVRRTTEEANKGRRQQFTLWIVGLVVTQLVAITLALVAITNTSTA